MAGPIALILVSTGVSAGVPADPPMSDDSIPVKQRPSTLEVEDFLRQVAATPKARTNGPRGRLIFAMDATASREPTWAEAARIQAEMFREASALGGLEIQLCFYRGYRELQAAPWSQDASTLLRQMRAVYCTAGYTQIRRVLQHAIEETRRHRLDALVFVGDCMEEDPAALAALAGQLGLLGVPAFLFQEGQDPHAEQSFRQIARLSGGAYSHFDARSPNQLRDLLSAVAVFAAGGRAALAHWGQARGAAVLALSHQLKRG